MILSLGGKGNRDTNLLVTPNVISISDGLLVLSCNILHMISIICTFISLSLYFWDSPSILNIFHIPISFYDALPSLIILIEWDNTLSKSTNPSALYSNAMILLMHHDAVICIRTLVLPINSSIYLTILSRISYSATESICKGGDDNYLRMSSSEASLSDWLFEWMSSFSS